MFHGAWAGRAPNIGAEDMRTGARIAWGAAAALQIIACGHLAGHMMSAQTAYKRVKLVA